jgi:predicted DNA-binding antitoxin AbrB/MazE fold protein
MLKRRLLTRSVARRRELNRWELRFTDVDANMNCPPGLTIGSSLSVELVLVNEQSRGYNFVEVTELLKKENAMTITVEATYENGVLRPLTPLALAEQEKVQLIVRRSSVLSDKLFGIGGCGGNAETFDRPFQESEPALLQPSSAEEIVRQSAGTIKCGDPQVIEHFALDKGIEYGEGVE